MQSEDIYISSGHWTVYDFTEYFEVVCTFWDLEIQSHINSLFSNASGNVK